MEIIDKIEFELPPQMDTSININNNSPKELSSPINADMGSLFQALSNKDKLRNDVDGVEFIKQMKNTDSTKKYYDIYSDSGERKREKSRDRDKYRDSDRDRDRDRDRDKYRDREYERDRDYDRDRDKDKYRDKDYERERDRDRDRDDYDRDLDKERENSSTAQNLFSHLKNISHKVEEEDERERKKNTYPEFNFTNTQTKNDGEERAILLQSYHLLKAQGIKSEMLLDITTDVNILRSEVSRMQTEISSQKCIKFSRKALIALVSGIEFLNHKYDPMGLHLNGWSEHVMTTLGDYDSVFMRLYEKYKDQTGALSPEAELILLLGGSGLMFHLTQSFINQNVPKFTEVANESPELADKIAGIMASKYSKSPSNESSDSDDDVIWRKKGGKQKDDNNKVKLPTEMLSTPAFPAMIQQMVAPRQETIPLRPTPEYTPYKKTTTDNSSKASEQNIKEISVPPLKEKSENVLVIS